MSPKTSRLDMPRQVGPDPRFELRTDRTGFTFVEVVIVVLVMGIMAATVAPRFGGALANRRADAVARRLVADLRMGRRHAMSTGTNQEVEFFTAPAHGYRLPGIPAPGKVAADHEVVLAEMAGATTHAADFDGNTTVTFDAYGRPHTGSPLAPLVDGSVAIFSGGSTRIIVVDSTTGRASLP